MVVRWQGRLEAGKVVTWASRGCEVPYAGTRCTVHRYSNELHYDKTVVSQLQCLFHR